MTQIKKVKTQEGVQFYPQTHTKAVIDDNGYTAENRLGAMQDEINQAQLKIGAVPSDLAPTEDSTNWVTSGGVYNAIHSLDSSGITYDKNASDITVEEALDELYNTKDEYENGGVELDLTSGTTLQKSISGPTWGTGGYSSFINMTEYAGQEISITANTTYSTTYAFTSSASIGNNNSYVDSIVSGRAVEMIPAGTAVTDTVPNGTSYLCLRRSSTSSRTDTDMMPTSVVINETEIDITGGTILKARINFPTWTTGGQRRCSIIPLPYGGRIIEITANDNYQCTYAFFKNAATTATNGAVVSNFAKNSMTSFIAAGKTVIKEIPANTTHLYLFRDYSSSTTAVAYMPKKVFVKNNLKLAADSVRYSDYYNKDSNVQAVLESVDTDIRGVEVLDKSTFTDIGINDIQSPVLLLYKGDTVTISGNTNHVSHVPISRWYDEYMQTLVPRTSGTRTYTYTATEDMYVLLQSYSGATFTITRANKRIDNIERACHDIPNKLYLAEMLGNARKAEYETISNSYIGEGLTIKTGNGFYTSPIALSAGETIHLYCGYNGWTIFHLVLSDAEGNLISNAEKTITNTHYTYRAKKDCYIVASGIAPFSVIIIGNSKIQDYMDDYDARNSGTSILDFYANKQTENMLRQLNWGYNANNGGTGVVKPLCLLHFSDIHNNEVGESGSGADGVSNINRIVTFYNKYKKNGSSGFIHDIIHTGDCVVSDYGQAFPWTTSEDVAKILNVIGNHDLQSNTGGMVAVYNTYFAPYVEGWGVTLPENAAEEGRCYYYKDYTANKVRLITLMNWGWLGKTGTTQTYLASQKTWFQGVLADAKTQGLTVVCAVHTHPANVTMLEGCSFNSWEYRYHGDVNGSRASTPVADSTNVGGYADDVQNFIDAGGDFACWICGHTHFDAVGPLSGFPDQFCIIVENAACKSYWCADHRITGTLSQDCFNVMSIDTYCKRVNVMRIGSNFASALQHKGAFSYDYKNKKLLNCW